MRHRDENFDAFLLDYQKKCVPLSPLMILASSVALKDGHLRAVFSDDRHLFINFVTRLLLMGNLKRSNMSVNHANTGSYTIFCIGK